MTESGSAGLTRLQGELALREGDVPTALDRPLAATRVFQIERDAFLLSLPMGLTFHYRRGLGTVFHRAPEVSDAEVDLFFEGSVFGAIAWLNGYVPLHASAVHHEGEIYAFTGPSGAGKSTIAAALTRRDLAHWTDDVLVLDLADPQQVLALPGPGRMKLWNDALELTRRTAGPAVRPGIDKFYVADVPRCPQTPMPIRRLYLLSDSDDGEIGVAPIRGTAAFNPLRSSYYRPNFFRALADPDHYFQTAMRLSRSLELARFSRPRSRPAFEQGVTAIEADIRAAA